VKWRFLSLSSGWCESSEKLKKEAPSSKGEFWICSEKASFGIDEKSF